MSSRNQIEPLRTENTEGSMGVQAVNKQPDPKAWRDKLSFWFLGFNNKMGYVVVITAAKDILLATLDELQVKNVEDPRHCRILSTGVVLLVATIPVFIIQYILSRLPMCHKSFVSFSILLEFFGFVMLGIAMKSLVALTGVALISLGFGMGDYELSKQSLLYNVEVTRSFKHGTNAAMVWGSLYYAVLRSLGISMDYVFLILLSFPLLAILLFWFLLRGIKTRKLSEPEDSEESMGANKRKSDFELFEDKCLYIMYLLKHMLPFGFVLLLQAFVNQGLYEFIYFRGNILNIDAQFRFYICIYNIGVYACLTTRNLFTTRYVWTCFILQLLTTTAFLLDAYFFFMGFLWCVFLLIYIQGIVTGVAHTSTIQMLLETEESKKSDMVECTFKNFGYFMIVLGGFLALAIHSVLSNTQEPRRP